MSDIQDIKPDSDNKIPQEEKGWVAGITEGTVSKDLLDTSIKNPNTNFKLESKEDLWFGELGNQLKEKYGDQVASEKMDELYSEWEKSYSEYNVGSFHSKSLNEPYVSDIDSWIYNDNVRVKYNTQKTKEVWASLSGASRQGDYDDITDPLYDVRARGIDMNIAELKDGTLVSGNIYDLVDNKYYTDKDGRQIKGFYYDAQALNDPLYGGQSVIKAQYYGEPAPLGSEGLSMLDYYGVTTPTLGPKTWGGSFVDGVYDGFAGIFQSLSAIGEAATAAVGLEDSALNDWFEHNNSMFGALKTSSSRYAQENTFSAENFFHMTGEIVSQFGAGAIAGRGASGLAQGLGYSATKAGKIGTKAAAVMMGFHGAGDMYNTARSHGFSSVEAGWLHLVTAGTMIHLNKLFGVADDWVASKEFANDFQEKVLKNMPYVKNYTTVTKETAKETAEEATEEAAKKAFKQRLMGVVENAARGTKNAVANGKPVVKASLKESGEEISELIAEETIKQVANGLKYAFDDDGNIEYGKGRFLTVTDEGYWEGIGEGLVMSALGGALGGVISNSFNAFRNNKATEKTTDFMLQSILDKKDEEFFKILEEEHAAGKLGDKNLSIIRNEKNDGWLPATEGRINMNDANKAVMMQQYNYLKSVVNTLGGADAANAFIQANPELKEKLENTSLTKDVKDLNMEYAKLQMETDVDLSLIRPVLMEGATTQEVEKAIKQAQEKNTDVDPETVRRAIEIRVELDNIRNGKTAAKYYVQAMVNSKDSVFNPDSEKGKALIEKYGEDFVNNLIIDLQNSALKSKVNAEKKAEKKKENDKLINNLKDDLSNVNEIEHLFDGNAEVKSYQKSIDSLEAKNKQKDITDEEIKENNRLIEELELKKDRAVAEAMESGYSHSPLSDEAKKKLKEKLKKYEPSKELKDKLKDSIREEVNESGLYSKEAIAKSVAYKKLAAEHPHLKEEILEFMSEFYQSRLEIQLEKADTLKKIKNVQVDQVMDIFQHISDVQIPSILGSTNNNPISALEGANPKEVAQTFAKEVTNDPDYTDGKYKGIGAINFGTKPSSTMKELFPDYNSLTKILNQVSNSADKDIVDQKREIAKINRSIDKLEKELAQKEDSLKTEEDTEKLEAEVAGLNSQLAWLKKDLLVQTRRLEKLENGEYDNTGTGMFLKNFDGDSNSISSTSDIAKTISTIQNQIDSNTLANGTSTYNDVDAVQNALNAVEVRIGLIDALLGETSRDSNGNIVRKPGLIDGLSSIKKRSIKINNDVNTSITELINEDNNTDTDVDKMFADIMFSVDDYVKLSNDKEVNTEAKGFWDRLVESADNRKASNNLLTEEERQKALDVEDKIHNAERAKAILSSYREELKDQLDTAQAGRDAASMVKSYKESAAIKVKNLMDVAHDTIYASGWDGVIETAPEPIREFMDYKLGSDKKDLSDQTVAMDYIKLVNAMDYLSKTLTEEEKFTTVEKLYKNYKAKGSAFPLMEGATMLYHSMKDFDSVFKSEISNMKDTPSMDQKMSAYFVSAHMNSDVSNILKRILPGRDLSNVLAVFGIGGSGKSKMVLGLGAKIGQYLQSKKHGSENTQVLLASNHSDQIQIMKEASDSFNMTGVKSIDSKNGLTLEELVDVTESGKGLDNVSTIFYDEATFIPAGYTEGNKTYDKFSPLEKLIHNIKVINENRGEGKPKLKLVLMGDPSQNGAVDKQGNSNHIGQAPNVFAPKKLTDSYRSRVAPLLSVVDELSNMALTSAGISLTNVDTEYGIINNDEKMNLLGGVKFVPKGNSVSDVIENATEHIKSSIEAKGGKENKFTVGIATDGELTQELKDFQAKYPEHVKVFTHTRIQGQEFDYVIGVVNRDTFGDTIGKDQEERLKGIKLGTTIGRAKYFAAMINETERVFNSNKTDNVTIASQDYLGKLSEDMFDLMSMMIENEESIPETEIKPTPEVKVEEEAEEKHDVEALEAELELEKEIQEIHKDLEIPTPQELEAQKQQELQDLAEEKKRQEEIEKERLNKLSNYEGQEVTYKGFSFIVKKEGNKFILENSTQIIEFSSEDVNLVEEGIEPKREETPKYKVELDGEEKVTVNGNNYTINTDAKGNIISLTPSNNPKQRIKNERLIVAVEIQRNKTEFKQVQEEEVNDSEYETILNNNVVLRKIENVLSKNLSDKVDQALDRLYSGKSLTPSEMLALDLWVTDALISMSKLFTNNPGDSTIEKAYNNLELINELLYNSTNIKEVKEDEKVVKDAGVKQPRKEKPKSRAKQAKTARQKRKEKGQLELFTDLPTTKEQAIEDKYNKLEEDIKNNRELNDRIQEAKENYNQKLKDLEEKYSKDLPEEDFDLDTEAPTDLKSELEDLVEEDANSLPSIEELDDQRDAIVDEIEAGTKTAKDLEDIDNKIAKSLLSREDAAPEDDTDIVESPALDEEFGSSDLIFSQIEDRNRRALKEVEKKGYIVAYSNNTITNKRTGATGIDLDIENLANAVGIDSIVPRDAYKTMQLRAMGIRVKDGYSYKDFDYELMMYNPVGSIYNVSLVATAKKGEYKGLKVIVGNIPTTTLKGSDSIGSEISQKAAELVQGNNRMPVFKPVSNVSTLIHDIGKGRLDYDNTGVTADGEATINNTPLSTFLREGMPGLDPNVFISDKVFINTNPDSEWRGEAFLLYSYNDINNMNAKNLKDLVAKEIETYDGSPTDVYDKKSFKNGLGIIRLRNMPMSLDYLKEAHDSMSDSSKSINTIVNTRKGHTKMVQNIAQLAEIISYYFKDIDADVLETMTSNSVSKEIFKNTPKSDKQYNEAAAKEVVAKLKKLRGTNPEAFKGFVNLISQFVKSENAMSGIGKPRVNAKGETWPTFKKGSTSVLRYAPKRSLGQVENPQNNYEFNLFNFFESVSKTAKSSQITDKELLDVFTDVLSSSKTYKHGLYLKPNMIRTFGGNKSANRSFALAQKVPGLNDGLGISVKAITSPPMYFNAKSVLEDMSAVKIEEEEVRVETPLKPTTSTQRNPIINEMEESILALSSIDTLEDLKSTHSEVKDSILEAIDEVYEQDIDISEKDKLANELESLLDLLDQEYEYRKDELKNQSVNTKVVNHGISLLKEKSSELTNRETEEELSPETIAYKEALLEYVNKLEKSVPFILTPKDLKTFMSELDSKVEGANAYLSGLLDKGKITKGQVDSLAAYTETSLDALKSKVVSTPEITWEMIEENMAMDISEDMLPIIDGSRDRLSNMLVSYHRAKLSGSVDTMKSIEADIRKDHDPSVREAKDINKIINSIVDKDILTREDLEAKIAEVQALGIENNIDTRDAILSMIDKYKSNVEVEAAIKSGKGISEAIDNLNEGPLKDKLKALTKETLDDKLSLEGLEVINETLQDLEKFVSSTLDTDNKIEKTKLDFQSAVKSIEEDLKALSQIVDSEVHNSIMEMFYNRVNEVTEVINSKIAEQMEIEGELNPYKASQDMLLPNFKHDLFKTEITKEMTELISKFKLAAEEGKARGSVDTWVKTINGELTGVDPETVKLKGDIVQDLIEMSGGNMKVVRDLLEYQAKKENDNTCK